MEIHDLWRFHTSDDPDGKLGWANPEFDDTSWQLSAPISPWMRAFSPCDYPSTS